MRPSNLVICSSLSNFLLFCLRSCARCCFLTFCCWAASHRALSSSSCLAASLSDLRDFLTSSLTHSRHWNFPRMAAPCWTQQSFRHRVHVEEAANMHGIHRCCIGPSRVRATSSSYCFLIDGSKVILLWSVIRIKHSHLGLGLDFSFGRQCGLRPSSLNPRRAACATSLFTALRCPLSLGHSGRGSPLGRNNGERLLSSLHSPHALLPHEYVAQNFGEA